MTWNPDEEIASESKYALLPKALYRVVIEKVETKVNNVDVSKIGVNMMFTVIDYDLENPCQFSKSKIFSYFTWSHPNDIAVQMGRKKIADILFAAEKIKQYQGPSEFAEELLGQEILVNVIQQKRSDTGELKNEIAGAFNLQMKSRKDAHKPFPKLVNSFLEKKPSQINEIYDTDDVPF